MRNQDCLQVRGTTLALQNTCGLMTVDVNSFKKPNQVGVDIFRFVFTKYGIIPEGSASGTSRSFSGDCRDKTIASGYGCTAWVIYKENMDYLHCNNLAWTGPIKCQ